MSVATGRVFTGLIRAVVGRKPLRHTETWSRSVICARSLTQSCTRRSKDKVTEEEVNIEPMKFSTSKAGSKSWKIDISVGGEHERPWWKVLPISLFGIVLLLWCTYRAGTEVDEVIGRPTNPLVPELVQNKEPLQSKPS